jgi:hypothetical protein
MRVVVRAARPGDGAGLAQVWLENASYYVGLFPDDFRMPDQAGLVDSFEVRLGQPPSTSELRLVAVVDGAVAAFVDARLTDPDDGAAWEMLADRPYRRVHVEALGTADAFQRQVVICRRFSRGGPLASAWLSQSSNRRLGHEWATEMLSRLTTETGSRGLFIEPRPSTAVPPTQPRSHLPD